LGDFFHQQMDVIRCQDRYQLWHNLIKKRVLHEWLHNRVFGIYIENFIPKHAQSQILGWGVIAPEEGLRYRNQRKKS
jgi:hypothetical protein